MFRVGQKVVCIDNGGSASIVMKRGDVFDVIYIKGDILGVDCRPINSLAGAQGWFATRFRPIVERKTDISFSHEILRSVSEPVHSEVQS